MLSDAQQAQNGVVSGQGRRYGEDALGHVKQPLPTKQETRLTLLVSK